MRSAKLYDSGVKTVKYDGVKRLASAGKKTWCNCTEIYGKAMRQ